MRIFADGKDWEETNMTPVAFSRLGSIVRVVVLGLASGVLMPSPIRTMAGDAESGSATTAATAEKPSRKIEGRVTDRDGNPIVDALVQWGHKLDTPEKLQQTTTDADGKYQLEPRAWGIDYRLGVSAEGMAPQWVIPRDSEFEAPADVPKEFEAFFKFVGKESTNFKLEPQHRLSGIVVDEQGQPIPAVTVRADTRDGEMLSFGISFTSYLEYTPMPIPGAVPRTASTGPDGRFSFDHLPAEKVRLTLETPFRSAIKQNYLVDNDAKIVMHGSGRAGVVRVQVIDAETRDPVPRFDLLLPYKTERITINHEDGSFESKPEFIEGDGYAAHVFCDGYAPAVVVTSALPIGSNGNKVVALQRGQELSGQLVDASTGKAIANVPVVYGAASDGMLLDWARWEYYYDDKTGQYAKTDADGRFLFFEPRDGPKGNLFALIPGYGRLFLWPSDRPAANPDDRVQINLPREASVSGTLLRNGKPAVEVTVSVWRQDRPDKIHEVFERVYTDAEGKFFLGSLSPGKYGVSYSASRSRHVYRPDKLATVVLKSGEHKMIEPISIDKLPIDR
jgi:hypothetical protein